MTLWGGASSSRLLFVSWCAGSISKRCCTRKPMGALLTRYATKTLFQVKPAQLRGSRVCSAARAWRKFQMTAFSVQNAVLAKRYHVRGVSLTQALSALVAKKSLVVETLVLFQAKQSVNSGTQDKFKEVVYHQKFFNKLPWVCNNNKTFLRDNSHPLKECHLNKWDSFHLKVCPPNTACHQTKWVNSLLNKACRRIRVVKSRKLTSNQPTLWEAPIPIFHNHFEDLLSPVAQCLRKIQPM